MLHKVIKIHPKDNVLVALTDLLSGEKIHFENSTIELSSNVQAKHKSAADADIAGVIPVQWNQSAFSNTISQSTKDVSKWEKEEWNLS